MGAIGAGFLTSSQPAGGGRVGLPSSFEAPHPGVRHPRSRRRGQWSALSNGLIAGCFGLLVFLAFWSAATESPLGPVERWATYRHSQGVFTIEYPAGWSAMTRGDERHGQTRIWRTEQISLTVWNEPFRLPAYPMATGTSVQYQWLRDIHREAARQFANMGLFGDYQAGRAGDTTLGGRPAVWSRLDLRSDSDQLRGYQVTSLAGEILLLMVATAPADSWDDFEPIALHMLRSLRFGGSAAGSARP